jgi:16S rRNA (cytosine1402-N4)-methyltransferase
MEPATAIHIPILVKPIVQELTRPFETPSEHRRFILDCTLGGGGHTSFLLQRLAELGQPYQLIALDQDIEAVERARRRFSAEIGAGFLEVHHGRFTEMEGFLRGRELTGLLADLGFSSDQMDDPSRGLSFSADGPLDMRLDPSRGLSCLQLLKQISERELADLIYEFGEERFSRRIAAAIIEKRRAGRLPETSRELAELITHAIPGPARHSGRIHPATRTFQALRIAVNDELKELDWLLERGILSVQPGGRVAIISFHSLEDRKVKSKFRDKAGPWEALTKKPIEPDDEEIHANPRSRSAKLRIATRTGLRP